MATAKYRTYINSLAWEERKLAYYAKHEKVCSACGSVKSIHLHHHSYENLGRERDGELLPLCETCHKLVHAHHRRVGGSLTDATFAAVALISGRKKPRVKRDTRSEAARAFIPRNQRLRLRDEAGRLVNAPSPRDGRGGRRRIDATLMP